MRTEPMACLTDAVCNSNQRSLLTSRCRNQVGFPGKLQVKTVVGTAHEKNNTNVSCDNVEGGNKDCASGCCGDDGPYDVVAGFAEVT